MKLLLTLPLMFLALAAAAADGPFNLKADAKLDIKQALSRASVSNTPVLVIFGANWCGDCKALEKAITTGAVAPLMARDFQIVKVNVSQVDKVDKNLDIAGSYGIPMEKGTPAVAILSPKGDLLYATTNGELSSARKMGDQGIYDFFKKVSATTTVTK